MVPFAHSAEFRVARCPSVLYGLETGRDRLGALPSLCDKKQAIRELLTRWRVHLELLTPVGPNVIIQDVFHGVGPRKDPNEGDPQKIPGESPLVRGGTLDAIT